MRQSIAILGRQPAIGLAELESLYGADKVRPVGNQAALLDAGSDTVTFSRLGGSIKLGEVMGRVDNLQWPAIEKQLRSCALEAACQAPDGKIKLGLSVQGLSISLPKLGAMGLNLKKALRNLDREGSVRVVPNKELELNSAQVLHNGLATPNGIELLIIRDGQSAIIARTTDVQDIDAYAKRDQGRPKRDARVGMLPPKLAQTIINLALAGTPPSPKVRVLDPFCGTGVVLQEAMLMGYSVIGSDIDQRMGDYTMKNLDWLRSQYPETEDVGHGWQLGDATTLQWRTSDEDGGDAHAPASINAVACEGYLGQPFSTLPKPEKLADVKSTCNTILRKFLANIGGQIKPGTRLCLAVPAWQVKPGQFQHLSVLDRIEELGYNRVSFKHVEPSDLIYARADQIVARELLVLIKK